MGGVFEKLLVNPENQAEAIQNFSNLTLPPSEFVSANGLNWTAISESIGSTDARLMGYLQSLQQADGTIDNSSASMQGYAAYLRETGQAYDFTALKATLLNSALNAGIMLAVVAAVKTLSSVWDFFNVTVAESQEKIQQTTERLNEFNAEYESLSARNPDSLSETEKERLDYLDERIEKEKEMLELQTANAAQEEIGGKFTDLFDKDSFSHKMFMEKYAKFSPFEMLFGDASDNITVLLNNTKSAISSYHGLKDDIAYFQKELASSPIGSVEYENSSMQLGSLQAMQDNYDFSKMQDQLLRWKEKKLVYEDAIAQLEEDAANPYISSGSRKEANEKIEEYQHWLAIAEKYIGKLSEILHTPQLLIDSLDERLSNLSASDLQKHFSETEIEDLATMTFDKDASIQDLERLLQDAQEKADEDPIEAELSISSRENLKTDPRSETRKKLAEASADLDKLSSSYHEFKELGYVTAQSLEALPDVFQDLEGFDLFAEIAGDPSQDVEQIQEAFNELTAQYLLSKDTLTGLFNASESEVQSYIANLKQMGIQNAEELVNQVLSLPTDIPILNNAEEEYFNYLEHKKGYDSDYINSIYSKNSLLLAALGAPYQADYYNWLDMLTKKAEAYNAFVNAIKASQSMSFSAPYSAYGMAKEILRESNGKKPADYYIKNYSPFGIPKNEVLSRYNTNEINNARNLVDATDNAKALEKKLALDLSTISPDFGSNSSPIGGGGSGSGSSAPAPTPQTYDWIEKKLSAIADQTERAGKAFDKAFFLSSSRKKFHAYLSQISADLNANQTAAAVYQEKMNAVGLSDTWIDKIQNGSYSIEDISDETLKNQISEYENYYDKKKKCEEAITALEEKRAQAQKSYADKIIAAHDREISKIEKKISRRKALVSLKEVFGFSASGKDYKNQQSDSNSELSKLRKQDESLRKLQKTTAKGSEAWNAYQDQIKKNKEKTQELTQSIAELAVKMAELPTERLNKYLEKNKEKQELYEAKIAASGNTKNKNTWIGNQITLVKRNQNKTQSAAETTSKNLETSKSKFTAAKNKDKKKQPKSGKKQADNYYKKIKAYTKKNKEIPASLITKLTNAGMNQLAAAASNYNANLAANETAQAAAELAAQTSQKEISELAVKRFQNTKSSYEQKQTDISRRSEYISSSVSRSEAQGRLADRSYYDALISLEQQNQKSLTKERNKLQKTLNTLAASGKIREFSEEWLEMTDSIYQVDQALLQSKETLLEYQNQLKQIDFDHFDYLQEQIDRLTQEADFYINVMSDKPLTNETGLTQHGTATLGLHYQKSEIYQNQAAQYGKEIDKLNKALSKDPTNTTLISQLQQYQDMQKECIQNAQNEKQAIADLVQQGYQSLIDSLGKSISKYKELLQNAKNAHEYQKNISQQTDNISVLKKQISAYSSMSDSEESSAKLQKLMKELEDAENNLDETMYDKYLSDTQDAMDSMLDNLEDFLSELSQDTDRLIQSGIEMITGSTDAISSTLFNLSEEYHTTLSSSMAASWGSYGSAAGGVDAIISSFQNLLAATDQKNDEQAFQDAAGIYQNYKSYNKDLANAKKEKSDLKKKREKAKEQQEKAKKKLDKAKKKGKNSKEYKKAEKNWKAAKKEFDTLDKNYKDSEQRVNTLKAQQQAAKDSDKSTIQNFLSAIADKTPAKNSSSMDALDHAVLKITGGYITNANRKQILSLLGAANTNQAVNILKNLGLVQDAASGSSPAPNPSNKSPASGTAKKKNPSKKSKKKSSQSSKKKTSKKKNTSKSKKKSKGGGNSNAKIESNTIKYIRLRSLMKDPSVNQQVKDQITRNQAADGLNFDDIFWNNQNHNHSMFSRLSLKDTILNQNPSRISDTGNLSIITGDLILPDVTDPSEFASGMVNALKNDPTVQRALGTLVNTSLTSGNSLSTQKFI